MAGLSMLATLAQRNPQLAAEALAQQGIDLQTLAGGQGADVLSGGGIGDVLTQGSVAPVPVAPAAIPAPTQPVTPPGVPVPKPAEAPTGPAPTPTPAPSGAMQAPSPTALAGIGNTLLGGAQAPAQPRAPGIPVELSRGISNTGGLQALLALAQQSPQGQIPLGALLRGIQ